MPRLERTVTVRRSREEVFRFLADFTTTEQWDPGTISTRRVSGDGGVGTRYHNVSRFLGRSTELEYVVEELCAPRVIRLRGHNRTVTARDTMEVTVDAGATRVRYVAEFEFHGLVRLLAPVLRPALERLGDRAETQLRASLDGS
jgi:carbon monoxide dehydrogenase subunit G